MGRMKEKPRYNVLSVRVDDETWNRLIEKIGKGSISNFIFMALQEKLAATVLFEEST